MVGAGLLSREDGAGLGEERPLVFATSQQTLVLATGHRPSVFTTSRWGGPFGSAEEGGVTSWDGEEEEEEEEGEGRARLGTRARVPCAGGMIRGCRRRPRRPRVSDIPPRRAGQATGRRRRGLVGPTGACKGEVAALADWPAADGARTGA